MKNTKVICTIGPASLKKQVIKQMFNKGMNACRINLSHGDFKQYEQIIKNVKAVSNKLPIIIDTEGPEVRARNKELISFKRDQVISFPLSVKSVYKKLRKGDKVLLNDGLNQGLITKVKGELFVKMIDEGVLKPNQSICFPGKELKLPLLTTHDKKGLELALKNDLAFIAVSYTSSALDVKKVKRLLKSSTIKVIAKIENEAGVNNIDEIIEVADAVLIARGDLGVTIPSERVPLTQKKIIAKCNEAGKPVIVATQMMESMINNNDPTRAETSDVANAIIDGADCLMLSGETSIGLHPSLVVQKMSLICRNTERYWTFKSIKYDGLGVPDVITNNAFIVARELDAKIICLTRSGYTARMISRFKPRQTIFAVTPDEIVGRQLMINYGVQPIHYSKSREVLDVTNYCLNKGLIKPSDFVVFIAGLFVKETTNTIIAFKVSDLKG